MPDGPSVATPAAFTITTASTTAKLDATRKAQVAFTATNASSQPLKGRARVVPLGNAKAEWFAVDGDAERPFAAGGTQQYTVRINVPASAAPGKYTFQVKMTAPVNPDELYGEGPQVSFEVLKPPVKTTPIPWMWIIIAVVALLVMGGGGFVAFQIISSKATASADPPTLAFGSRDTATTSATKTVTLRNSGNADLVLQQASLTGGVNSEFKLVKDNCSKTTVKAGQSCTVEVAFAPLSVGDQADTLTFPNGSNLSVKVALSGTGTGQPQGSLDNKALAFGNVDLPSTSPPHSVTLSNTGNADLVLQKAAFSGDASAEFSLAKDACSNTSIKPGGSCSVAVAFTPANTGARAATLTFQNSSNLPLTVSLSGTGTISLPGLYAGTWFPNVAPTVGITRLVINETSQGSGVLEIQAFGGCAFGTPCTIGSTFVRFTAEPVQAQVGGYALQIQLNRTAGTLTVIANSGPALTFHRPTICLACVHILPPLLLP